MKDHIDVDCYRAKFGALALRAYNGDDVTGDLQKLLADLVAHAQEVATDSWRDKLKHVRGALRVHLSGVPSTDLHLHARTAEPGFKLQDRFYEDAIAELTKLIVEIPPS